MLDAERVALVRHRTMLNHDYHRSLGDKASPRTAQAERARRAAVQRSAGATRLRRAPGSALLNAHVHASLRVARSTTNVCPAEAVDRGRAPVTRKYRRLKTWVTGGDA